ncbi:hypothetical protein R1flu_007933 [Riccia fluitans]|uniref:Uncharacterized protein n=1 Tax=Riccia fluitans TaxID=41844 RepID=A0ABD1Z091_9MARC
MEMGECLQWSSIYDISTKKRAEFGRYVKANNIGLKFKSATNVAKMNGLEETDKQKLVIKNAKARENQCQKQKEDGGSGDMFPTCSSGTAIEGRSVSELLVKFLLVKRCHV